MEVLATKVLEEYDIPGDLVEAQETTAIKDSNLTGEFIILL